MSGRLTVLSGPSGVGKGTVVAAVRDLHPEVWVSVSVTTRRPRRGEVDGAAYHFIDDGAFDWMVDSGELLEWATYTTCRYGTPRGPVVEQLGAGQPALLEIDLLGARQVRAAMPDAQLVFLAPPSMTELVRRLAGRGSESADAQAARLARAEQEMAAADEFDAVIVNDNVRSAAQQLVDLIRAPVGSG